MRVFNILFLHLSFCFSHFKAQCVFQGINNGNTFANDTSIGTLAWSNPGNEQISDNVRSIATQFVNPFTAVNTNYLSASGFGFSIPLTATICGILINFEKRAGNLVALTSINDNSVKIIKGGLIVGTEQANSTSWPATDIIISYGSNVDLWGTTWTPADINAGNFGAVISSNLSVGNLPLGVIVSAEVNNINITVYYVTNVALPVELLYFKTECGNKKINIHWETMSETNNDYYTIQQSTNAFSWNKLAIIKGAGNSISKIEYHYEDHNPSKGISYYRLQQTDFAGEVKLFNAVSINCDEKTDSVITAFPTTVQDYLTIEMPVGKGKVEFSLFDMTGRLVKEEILIFENSKQALVNLQHISSGMYFIQLIGNTFEYRIKINKQ